ncbi:MAG: hypothetical protein AAFQ43_03205 [Bacteroidota bacterium]
MRVTKLLDPVTSGPPLPSAAVLVIAGLALLCLALAAALVLNASDRPVEYAGTVAVPGIPASTGTPEAAPNGAPAPTPEAAASAPEASGEAPATQTVAVDSLLAAFPAEPGPIPTGMITRIEAAETEPVSVELGHLLEAIQTGFGTESAQLEPTLRPYVFRIAGRLSVRAEPLRIAATAPDAALAQARAATLRRLFDLAGVSTGLSIGAGTGPHALSIVSD